MGSDGFEKVLIGTLGPRETFLGVAKGRAAEDSVTSTDLMFEGASAFNQPLNDLT